MTIWDFFDNHWFLAFFAICFSYGIVARLIGLVKQLVRLPMLLVRGWPPALLDADGDVHYPNPEPGDKKSV